MIKNIRNENRIVIPVKCICSEENVIYVIPNKLRRFEKRSCGCLAIDTSRKNGKNFLTHGESRTRLYSIWRDMKHRCYNPKNRNYHHYGEKGIIVCDKWKNSFENFRDWARLNSYEDNLTIHRKNNDKNYEPSNCMWATDEIQARTKSSNRQVTIDGITKILVEWSEDPRCTVSYHTIVSRLQLGWDEERAIFEPLITKRILRSRRIQIQKDNPDQKSIEEHTGFGLTMNIFEWSEHELCIVSYPLILSRLKAGWTIEEAITKPCNRHLRRAKHFQKEKSAEGP